MKTAQELTEYAISKANKPKTIYVLGTFGQEFTSALLEQKCRQLPFNRENRAFLTGFVDQGYQAFDCCGLMKAFLWDDNPGNYNAAEDENEAMMYARATVKGNINTLPETPGTLVFMQGHVGVYIGNGYCVEATPNNEKGWGVIKTPLKGRGWTTWAQYKRISYDKPKPIAPVQTGWRAFGKTWYYYTSSTEYLKNTVLIEGTKVYYFDEKGVWITDAKVVKV